MKTNEIKVDTVIKFLDSIGIVKRVLCDNSGCVAQIRFLGNSEYNIKTIEVEKLQQSNELELVTNAFLLIERLCKEIYDCTSNQALRKKLVELDRYLDYKAQ